jgi:peptidyl-prolyl cis-trans isomerase C
MTPKMGILPSISVISVVLVCLLFNSQSIHAADGAFTALAAPGPNTEKEDLIVATVSRIPITEKQVLSIMKYTVFMEMEEDEFPEELLGVFPQGLFDHAVDTMINRTLLLDKAQQQGIKVSEAALEKRLQDLSKNYSSYKEFNEKLAAFGITEHELRRHVEETLMLQAGMNQTVKDTEAAEEEIERFYNDRQAKVMTSEQVRASHILLKTDPDGTPGHKADVKRKLEKIKTAIENGTITFAEAAKQYSQDSENAILGGDLGFIIRGRMDKALENAVFNTPIGTTSPIFESQSGYHLIHTHERRPPRSATFEEMKDVIGLYFDQRAKRRATIKFMGDLKAGAVIEILMTQKEFADRNAADWARQFSKKN